MCVLNIDNIPASQKRDLQSALNASFAVLARLPPHDEARLFTHALKWCLFCIVFAAKVVPYLVHILH